jgi:hypothetical protein
MTLIALTFLQPSDVMWREALIIMVIFASVLLVRPKERDE